MGGLRDTRDVDLLCFQLGERGEVGVCGYPTLTGKWVGHLTVRQSNYNDAPCTFSSISHSTQDTSHLLIIKSSMTRCS